MGVPTAKAFVCDLRLTKWIEALLAPAGDRSKRLLHRTMWADFILETRQTNWPRTIPYLPLRATATVNAYLLLREDQQAVDAMTSIKGLLEDVESVDTVPQADVLQHICLRDCVDGLDALE